MDTGRHRIRARRGMGGPGQAWTAGLTDPRQVTTLPGSTRLGGIRASERDGGRDRHKNGKVVMTGRMFSTRNEETFGGDCRMAWRQLSAGGHL
jgi:hypothetical protein